ncbi:unnamed protein product [Diamesa serratosioi]
MEIIFYIGFLGLLELSLSSVLVTDNNRILQLSPIKPFCRTYTDRSYVRNSIINTEPTQIRQVPKESLKALEKVCADGKLLSNDIQGGLRFIYPGTKWCGPGSIASNDSDLGRLKGEDSCCREHDHCFEEIAPGQCKKSICNDGMFTRVNCACDNKFRQCLHDLNTEDSNTLGAIFFNVVQVVCFQKCSILERNPQCDIKFYNSEPYIAGDSLPQVAKARFNRNLAQQESFAVFADTLYQNLVYRPFKAIGNFILVSKSIYFNPTYPVDERRLLN